jgi:hypothetical protein
MRPATLLVTAALAAILTLPATARERKLTRAQVPPAVLTAFEKAYPTAKALHFLEDDKDGKPRYEIESRDGTVSRDLLFAADGAVLEVEETVPEADLPAAVREAVKKSAKGATVKRAEKVTRGATVRFEIELRGGSTRELAFDADGKPVGK